MALNGLFCADVPLRNYSLTHSLYNKWILVCFNKAQSIAGVLKSLDDWWLVNQTLLIDVNVVVKQRLLGGISEVHYFDTCRTRDYWAIPGMASHAVKKLLTHSLTHVHIIGTYNISIAIVIATLWAIIGWCSCVANFCIRLRFFKINFSYIA